MRRAALAGAFATAVFAAPASAMTVEVDMPGRYFEPNAVTLVAGDSVLYRNTDWQAHDVKGPAGIFDSGRMTTGRSFAHRFDQTGSYQVVCTLHTFMFSSVEVTGAQLSPPAAPILAGETATLSGRVPAGADRVAIERAILPGPWELATAVAPAADGSFSVAVSPTETASFRAVSAWGASSSVDVAVETRVAVTAALRRGHHHSTVSVRADPSRPGAVALLQLYSPERFAWKRIARATLDARGRASFRVRAGLKRVARVIVARRLGGSELGRSNELKLRRGAVGPHTGHAEPHEDHGGHEP